MRKFVNWEEVENKKWYTCHACGRKTDRPKDGGRCPVCKKPLWELWSEMERKIRKIKGKTDE